MYTHTVRDLWIDMHDRFSQPNVPRFFEIQKEISKLSQGSLSMSSYFTKFKILWDELVHYQSFTTCTCVCTCGSQRNQLNAQQRIKFFVFLWDSMTVIRLLLLFMEFSVFLLLLLISYQLVNSIKHCFVVLYSLVLFALSRTWPIET